MLDYRLITVPTVGALCIFVLYLCRVQGRSVCLLKLLHNHFIWVFLNPSHQMLAFIFL